MPSDFRPYMHKGKPVTIDGVPFGNTYVEGDCYVAHAPLDRKDIDLLRKIEILEERVILKDALIKDLLAKIEDLQPE